MGLHSKLRSLESEWAIGAEHEFQRHFREIGP